MSKKVFLKVSMLSMCLTTVAAQAQGPDDQGQNKFGGIDAIINSLGDSDVAAKPDFPTVKNMVMAVPSLPIKKEPEVEKSVGKAPKQDEPLKTVEDNVLDTRVTEMPPGSRFTFKRNLFLPSNKSGFLFLDGEPKFAIDSGADINKILLMKDASSTPCALISNKSNIMMRGLVSDGKVRTHLDVDKMSFSTMSRPGYQDRTYIKIMFSPKLPKGVVEPERNSVDIHLTCQLPQDFGTDYKKYRLRDIDTTLNGLFNFSLPRYIEI